MDLDDLYQRVLRLNNNLQEEALNIILSYMNDAIGNIDSRITSKGQSADDSYFKDYNRNYLKKYNDLLKQAKSVKDILEIENHIRVIEEEIESTTGRLKYLNDQVAFSTLDLNIIKHKEQSQKSISLSERLGQALSGGWSGFIDFIVLIVRIWPVWILVVMFIYGLKMFRRRNK